MAGATISAKRADFVQTLRSVGTAARASANDALHLADELVSRSHPIDQARPRLDTIDRELVRATELARRASTELSELESAIRAAEEAERVKAPTPPPIPTWSSVLATPRLRAPRPARPSRPPGPTLRERAEAADLLGARGLAVAGGIVTLLGIVFLFALASNRGWLGPEARIVLGGVASAFLVAGGVVIHRRSGSYYAALAAVGAGIGGAYTTLLAAGALYDFIEPEPALMLAAVIAAIGAEIALRWRSQIVAGIGLVGAIAVPGIAQIGLGLSLLGTAFVAVVLAVTLALGIRQGWRVLVVAATAVSLPQILALVGWPLAGELWSTTALALVFAGIYLAAGLVLQCRTGREALDPFASPYVTGPAVLAGWSAYHLLRGESLLGLDAPGVVLLGIAIGYAALSGVFFARAKGRDLSVLLAAVALTVGAIAVALLVGGATLAVVWAIEAAALALLALRVNEVRFEVGALAYLALALVQALAHEAPPRLLYTEASEPGGGLVAVVAVAVAAAVFGVAARRWSPGAPFARLRRDLADLRPVAFAVSTALGLYAASLLVLQTAQWIGAGSTLENFEWGRVAVTGLWTVVATAFVVTGARTRGVIWWSGLVLFGWTLFDLIAYEWAKLPSSAWGVSACLIAAGLLVTGLVDGLLGRRDPGTLAPAFVPASAALVGVAATQLFESGVGVDARGVAQLAAGAFYGALAVGLSAAAHRRNLAALAWASGIVLALIALPQIASGVALVAALAVLAVSLAAVGVRFAEPRLEVAAAAPIAIGAVYALATLATPRELFVEQGSLSDGLIALGLLLGALGGLTALAKVPLRPATPDRFDQALGRAWSGLKDACLVVLGVLALDAASLLVLQVAQWIDAGSMQADFEYGRVAVTALWATVGAGLVTYGRGGARRLPRIGGVALLGFALVDVVTFGPAKLSSGEWALAAAFLAAGMFVAGLADALRGRRDPGWLAAGTLPVAAVLAGASALVEFDGHVRGAVLLAPALVFTTSSALVFAKAAKRNLSTLLWSCALVTALVAVPLLVLDLALVATLAVLAVLVSFIAVQVAEPRLFPVGSLIEVGAIAYALAVLATPRELFVEQGSLWDGIAALVFVLVALGSLVRFARKPFVSSPPDALDRWLEHTRPRFLTGATWLGGLLCLDAASLLVLQFVQSIDPGSTLSNFEYGRVVVTALWGTVGAVLVAAGRGGARRQPLVAGLAVLAFAMIDLIDFGWPKLSDSEWALAAALLAVSVLAAGFVHALRARLDLDLIAAGCVTASAALAGVSALVEFDGSTQGVALLAIAALFGGLAAAVSSAAHHRNLATLLWGIGLALALAGLPFVVANTALVAVLAGGSIALGLLAVREREPRLGLAALSIDVGAILYTVAVLGTPSELFASSGAPGDGVVALVLSTGALAGLTFLAPRLSAPTRADALDRAILAAEPRVLRAAPWTVFLLAIYAASLFTLQVVQWTGGSFETGQAAVSAVWGVFALSTLIVGLVEDLSRVRLAGFLLVGLTLAKIFLYDLSSLSAIARAFSFLAVGFALLLAGYTYQRLTAKPKSGGGRTRRRPPPTARPAH